MITTTYIFQNCRDGFNHIGVLIKDGDTIQTAKVHYINRTWESYRGQTAMRRACSLYLEQCEERAREIAKARTGRRRLCPAVEKEAAQILKGWAVYKSVKKHYKTL